MSEGQDWHQYPEQFNENDTPLIATIVKQLAIKYRMSAELWGCNVRVYCTSDQWIALLIEAARRIYRDND